MAFPSIRLRSALSLGGLNVNELSAKTWWAMEEHEIQTRAAAISFYAMLAMVPFIGLIMVFAVQLLPDLTGNSHRTDGLGRMTVEQFNTILEKTLPPEASGAIKGEIISIQRDPPVGLISIGLAITIWLASSLFVAVIDAMNRIYGVKERRSFIKLRLMAIVMTVSQAAILVGSLLLIVGWNWILDRFKLGSAETILATGALYCTVVLMVLVSFALAFYVAPDADQRWEWITPGSFAGSVLFLGSTLLFRLYVSRFANYDKTYGPLGGVMVLLFWFWISSLILLGAAQVNKIIEEASPLGKNHGQRKNLDLAPDFEAMKPVSLDP